MFQRVVASCLAAGICASSFILPIRAESPLPGCGREGTPTECPKK